MVLEKRAFYEYILQQKMGYVILKLVLYISNSLIGKGF